MVLCPPRYCLPPGAARLLSALPDTYAFPLTLTILRPWIPRGSWLMRIIRRFCRISLAAGEMVRRSLDMRSGAAMMVHKAIWERDCS